MAVPLFGANSLLDSDTITVSPVEDTSFPTTNLSDDRAFTVFKPSSSASPVDVKTDAGVGNTSDVDYFMLADNDLSDPAQDGNGAVTLTFASSADDISYSTIFTVTPSDDRLIARDFTKVTARFFRARFTRGTAFTPSLGELQWGTGVRPNFPIRFPFDPNAERMRLNFNRSQNGNIIGSVQRFTERRISVALRLEPSSFVDDNTLGGFRDFWDKHASRGFPFLVWWNPGSPGSFELDAFFGMIDPGVPIRRASVTPLQNGFRDVNFDVVGLKREL